MSTPTRRLTITATASTIALAAAVAAQNYVTDTVLKGTSLAGWHVLGAATWRAENGEYVGRPTASDGGWLVLDASLQDVGLFAHFRCTGGCKTGVLLRAEKAADGMKGLYV